MAKTYIDAVKYNIYAHFEVSGIVDKSDVVGAVFGQTEGLLGEELDLRDLQRNGRIGRIEVDTTNNQGKTIGSVIVPSSLDMIETAVIAAALETVDRVGPHEGKITVEKIEDNRTVKRSKVIDKAKDLLKRLLETQIPDSREITEMVRKEVRTAELIEYGKEKLAAGPTIETSDAITFVEGRADVINLLKNDITNVISIGGARVPQTIIELSKKKEVTVFLDGDRGGNIILAELINARVDIDFVARAPVGKEVEELTRKEMIKCIRAKVPFEQYAGGKFTIKRDEQIQREELLKSEIASTANTHTSSSSSPTIVNNNNFKQYVKETPKEKPKPIVHVRSTAPKRTNVDFSKELPTVLAEMKGSLQARFYSSSLDLIKEAPIKDIISLLKETDDVEAIVFDGIITQRLVDLAKEKGVKYIAGIRIGNVKKPSEGINFITS